MIKKMGVSRLLLAGGGLVVILLMVKAPSNSPVPPYEKRHFAMGTLVTLRLYADAAADSLARLACDEIDRVSALMSRYEPNSELTRFNRDAANEALASGPDMRRVIDRSLYWAASSDGAFDNLLDRTVRAPDHEHRPFGRGERQG